MRVVLGGYYGAGNLGDELLLGRFLTWLRESGHDAGVVTLDQAHTERTHRVAVADRADLAAVTAMLASADAFVLGGGGLFQDHDRFTVADLAAYPAPGVSYYAQLSLLARQLGLPCLLPAQGVGPLRSADARQVTREVFSRAFYVSVRDEASLSLLREIGVESPVDQVADPGWTTPRPERLDLAVRHPEFFGRRILAVVPRRWGFSEGWRRSLAAGLAEAASAGWGILWLPLQTSGQGDDGEVVGALGALLPAGCPQAVAPVVDAAEAEAVIASADALVAMRLHALILGAKNGVPTLAVEYDDKLSAVAAALGVPAILRLRPTDPASRFADGVKALVGTPPRKAREIAAAVGRLTTEGLRGRDLLLAALERLPACAPGDGWRDKEMNWIASWAAADAGNSRREAEAARREMEGMRGEMEGMRGEMESMRRSGSWRMTVPLRGAVKATGILRDQGLFVLLRRMWRAALRRTYHPVARRLVRRSARSRLAAILREHPGKTPVFFPAIVPWNLPLFQRPHQLARRLAERGYLYFFCVPFPGPDRVATFREVAPGVFITPHEDLIDALPGKLVHLYSTDNDRDVPWVRARLTSGDRMLYEYVDEIHEEISLCPIPVHAREKHAYLLRNEEVVCVATADKLFAEVLSRRSCNCGLVTNGVDVGHFSVSRGEEGPPARLRGIAGEGRPVIGYFGALARWLDYRLIAELARSRPGYEIVLIGPDYDGSADALRGEGLPNVHLPGVVDYRSLPQHACWFDVATVPFLVNEITESTSPIKLFEYMALGLPIVTTDLPECRKYASVAIGRDAAEFTAQIDRALASRDDQSRRALLRREAEENSWEAKAGAVAALLAQAVSSPPGMR